MPRPEESPLPLPVLEEFEEVGPLVGILIGSESDREAIEPAGVELDERGISWELKRALGPPGSARRGRVRIDGRPARDVA